MKKMALTFVVLSILPVFYNNGATSSTRRRGSVDAVISRPHKHLLQENCRELRELDKDIRGMTRGAILHSQILDGKRKVLVSNIQQLHHMLPKKQFDKITSEHGVIISRL